METPYKTAILRHFECANWLSPAYEGGIRLPPVEQRGDLCSKFGICVPVLHIDRHHRHVKNGGSLHHHFGLVPESREKQETLGGLQPTSRWKPEVFLGFHSQMAPNILKKHPSVEVEAFSKNMRSSWGRPIWEVDAMLRPLGVLYVMNFFYCNTLQPET